MTVKQRIISLAIMIITAIGLATPVAASPLTQFAAKCKDPAARILTFPAWYKGLDCDDKGYPTANELNDLWVIALNIVEWLVIAAAYLAVGFIVWGGFKYMKSRGEPGKLAEAKTAILQAVIGLGTALAAVAIVEFVTGIVKT